MGWLDPIFRRRQIYRDLSDEIRQHLEEKTDALMAEGMSRNEAELAARREFGNTTAFEERGRDAWRWQMVESLYGDAKFAVRQLRKNFGFALTAALALALGIGPTAAIFSVVNTVLLRPLPFPHSEQLTWLAFQDHSLPGTTPGSLSYQDYFDWRKQNHTFSGLACYTGVNAKVLLTGGAPRHLDAMTVSGDFFAVLGLAPMLGRDFSRSDESAGNHAVMLSYALWQSAFGGANDVAGTSIRLGPANYTVAGVMPRGFQFPFGSPTPELWVSMAEDAEGQDSVASQRGFKSLSVIGRRKPGVTLEQARADLTLISANMARQDPDNNKALTSALAESELAHMTGDTSAVLRLLFGAVAMVLLIACANVAGLLLARGSRRRAEFALRASLGAGRGAIVRQLLVESVVLSLCGGVAGIALAYGLLRAMVHLIPVDIPRLAGATIDGTALGFIVAISVITGLLFGVLPAWRMSELRPAQAIREGSRTVAGGRGEHRVQSILVIAQTAIGLVLLVSSGLLIRSLVHVLNVEPGFDPRNVLTARVGVPLGGVTNAQFLQFYEQLLARVKSFPGVQSASAGFPLPMGNGDIAISFSIEGRPVAKSDEPSEALAVAMPFYFETMRMKLLAGRTFEERDGTYAPPVMMINQAFARKYFPHEDPLGKHIRVGYSDGVVNRPVREVVGVIGDIRSRGLTAEVRPEYYLPLAQAEITNPYLTLRTTGDAASLEAALRAAVRELDKTLPLYRVSTMENYVYTSASRPRFQTFLLSCFAGIALVLAAVGLYGLLSYLVAQRTLEIGVRMALGARRVDVLRMIVRRGLTLALIGLVAGLAVSAATTRLLAGMLYGIASTDPAAFGVMAGVLLLVSAAASAVPAYRAAHMEPIASLREQ